MIATIFRDVLVVPNFHAGNASVQRAIERFRLCSPELELTRLVLPITAECNLGWSIGKHVENLAIRDVAYLMILKYRIATLVASHVRNPDFIIVVDTIGKALQREILACRVCPTDIAVNTTPPFLTLTALSFLALPSPFTISK